MVLGSANSDFGAVNWTELETAMIAAALTDIAGSSDVVDRGFVTYSNEAKAEMLGVAEATLEAHGRLRRGMPVR